MWGATLVKIRLLLIFCFNPRTRVGCDQFAHLASTTWRVSIHAPVWGATMRHHQVKRAVSFQSTHPCGVRLPGLATCQYNPPSFNPRTRVGCDNGLYKTPITSDVSIHAPVWGATVSFLAAQTTTRFQSTHPCGVRPKPRQKNADLSLFQSTHPCGVRQIRQVIACFNWSFQSTHPCGVRLPNSQHPL